MFHGKILWTCRQKLERSFHWEIPGMNIWPGLEIFLWLIPGNISYPFLRNFSNQSQEIYPYQFWRKCRPNLGFLGNFQRKFSEPITGKHSQDFLKSSSGIFWDIISIFLSKFTDQDLDPIVVDLYFVFPYNWIDKN